MTFPLVYRGEGQFEAASPYHRKRCEAFGIGELIEVEVVEDRSPQSHRHYFARIAELWQNLPEWLANDFTSPEHLRKYALIKSGHCSMRKFPCRSTKEAVEVADFLTDLDPYVICEIVRAERGPSAVLTVWRADSQSMQKMKKHRFQQSKDDVLQVIERLVASRPMEAVK